MYLSFHRAVILLTKNIINEALTLETSALQLSEVVVTGQAVGIERKRLTSSVDVITADQISSAPVVRLDQILQSRLPGTQVRLASGQPGTASIIRNRGPISANAWQRKHGLKGFWTRRITQEHRLVYKVSEKKGEDQRCTIIQCRFHYDDLFITQLLFRRSPYPFPLRHPSCPSAPKSPEWLFAILTRSKPAST